jgi:hypothetical protein
MKNLLLLLVVLLGYGAASGQGLELSLNVGSFNAATMGYAFEGYNSSTSISVGVRVMSIGGGVYVQSTYRHNLNSRQLDGYLEVGGMVARTYATRDLGTLGEFSSKETSLHVVIGGGIWINRTQTVAIGGRVYPGYSFLKKAPQNKASLVLILLI